jgi:hypothetical protein
MSKAKEIMAKKINFALNYSIADRLLILIENAEEIN